MRWRRVRRTRATATTRDRQIYLEMVGKYRQEQTVTLESDIKDAADLTRLDEREHRRKASVARDMVKKKDESKQG